MVNDQRSSHPLNLDGYLAWMLFHEIWISIATFQMRTVHTKILARSSQTPNIAVMTRVPYDTDMRESLPHALARK